MLSAEATAMPWEHCGAPVPDDEPCPACGITKQSWTVEWNATRTFAVKRRPLVRLVLTDTGEAPITGEEFAVVFADGSEVTGVTDELGAGKAAAPTPTGRGTLRLPGLLQADVREVEPQVEVRSLDGGGVELTCEIGKRYTLRVERALELHFKRLGDPRAGRSYRVRFDDGREVTGDLDPSGVLRLCPVPASGEAEVWVGDDGDDQDHYVVAFGELRPLDDPKGLQQRLNNLGFFCGVEDGDAGPATKSQLGAFQRRHGLEATGELDDATRRKLAEVH